MTYLESLRQAEPSPLRTSPLFDVAYQMPDGGWQVHERCDPWSTWVLLKLCAELDRQVAVRYSESRARVRVRVLLDLFSIGLSDRCGQGTEE
jgi:hypothetical protein